MDYNNIEALLDKYWAGETSLAEEQTLRDYFNSGNVDPKFAEAAPLFQFFKANQGHQLPDSFESTLIEKLEAINNQQPATNNQNRISLFTKITSMAAMLAMAFCIALFTMQPKIVEKQPLAWTDTYEDPEKAYEETMAALKLISSKLNRGKRETAKGLSKVKEKTTLKKKNQIIKNNEL